MGNVRSHLRAAGKAVANWLVFLMAVHVLFLFIILSLTQLSTSISHGRDARLSRSPGKS